MRLSCSLLIIVALSQLCEISSRPTHKEETIRFLQQFGYLPKDKNVTDINRKHLHRAIKKLQTNAHIEVTGKIDKNTLNLVRTPRCGVPDDARSHKRQKRFALLGSKWEKEQITWSFNHKNGPHRQNEYKIRTIIQEALGLWAANSKLTFKETYGIQGADIIVSFEAAEHPDVDHYSMKDPVLAHAFRPGSGLGGDVHFREDVDWNFDVMLDEQPPHGQKSFFAVALHELGHTLGLSHSDDPDAVMYGFIHKSSGVLHQDDIQGIHHIYGVPDRYREVTATQSYEDYEPESQIPDKCDTSYDAIALIRGELFIFKGRYMFRPDSNSEMSEIRALWQELPEDLTKIDSVLEDVGGQISFFIGRDIYMFRNSIEYVGKTTLSRLGIDESVEKIDAIFRWHYNRHTYIFSGDKYWRMRGSRADPRYPQLIEDSWRDVYDVDTIFDDGHHLYFFIGKFFYEFDRHQFKLNRMQRRPSAQNFMNCPGSRTIFNAAPGEDDFIDEDVEEQVVKPYRGPEKELNTENENSPGVSNILAVTNLVVACCLVIVRFLQ